MSAFQFCYPDPRDPSRQICEDIPVLIEPPVDTEEVAWGVVDGLSDAVKQDLASLVAVGQVADRVQDPQVRSRLIEAVASAVADVNQLVPTDVTLSWVAEAVTPVPEAGTEKVFLDALWRVFERQKPASEAYAVAPLAQVRKLVDAEPGASESFAVNLPPDTTFDDCFAFVPSVTEKFTWDCIAPVPDKIDPFE